MAPRSYPVSNLSTTGSPPAPQPILFLDLFP
jgi:hypothetical protein